MLGIGMIEERKHLEKSNWSWRSSLKVIDLWHPTTCNVMKHQKRTCKWKFAGKGFGAFMLYLLKKLVEEEILALPENDRDFSDVIVFHVWMVSTTNSKTLQNVMEQLFWVLATYVLQLFYNIWKIVQSATAEPLKQISEFRWLWIRMTAEGRHL